MVNCQILNAEHSESIDAFPGGNFDFLRVPMVGEHLKFVDDYDADTRHLARVVDVVHIPGAEPAAMIFVTLVEWPAHIQKADF